MYSLWSAGTYTSLSSEHFFGKKMTVACRNWATDLRRFDWLHRSLTFYPVHHSLYVHNNLNAGRSDNRQLKGFADSHVKTSLYLNKSRFSNFDLLTLHFVHVYYPEEKTHNMYRVTKKTGTFEKPNKNWRNPRKKIIDRNWTITTYLLRDSNPNYQSLKITSCRSRPPPRMHSFTATTHFKSSRSFV